MNARFVSVYLKVCLLLTFLITEERRDVFAKRVINFTNITLWTLSCVSLERFTFSFDDVICPYLLFSWTTGRMQWASVSAAVYFFSKEVPFQGGRAECCTVWIFPLTSFTKDVGNDVSDAIASHTSWLGIEADDLTQKPSATSIAFQRRYAWSEWHCIDDSTQKPSATSIAFQRRYAWSEWQCIEESRSSSRWFQVV